MNVKIKNRRLSLLLMFSMLWVANVLFINNAIASTSVWKVSKGDRYFYLGGTIHVLNAEDHPLPKPFLIAYGDANKLIFETDLDLIQSPKYQSSIMATMQNSDGVTLKKQLNRKSYQALSTFMHSRGLAAEQFAMFQPWAVSLMLTMLEYQRLGMLPEYGVDAYFNKRAQSDNKQLGQLETPEAQLAALSSMSSIDPNEFIEYTLQDLERLPEIINGMKAAWRNGDMNSLADHAKIGEMQSEFPDIYKTLLTDRNKHWIQQLILLNNDSSIEFVLVGALHLYGDSGLLQLLKKQGFSLELL